LLHLLPLLLETMADLRATEKKFQNAVYDAKSTAELNAVIKQWYHPEVEQREAGKPVKKGVEAVLAAEAGFFAMLEKGHFDKVEIHSISADADLHRTFADHTGYATFKGAPGPYPFHQLVEHEWKDGKIIREVFWHEKSDK